MPSPRRSHASSNSWRRFWARGSGAFERQTRLRHVSPWSMWVVTGKDARNAARDVGFVKVRSGSETEPLQIPWGRNTPVTCAQGLIELVLLLPGRMAARVRSEAARKQIPRRGPLACGRGLQDPWLPGALGG